MAHDSTIYTSPQDFNPVSPFDPFTPYNHTNSPHPQDRFLGQTPEMEPKSFVFGFGRRICPGKLLAEQSIFLTIAQTLAVFKISGPRQGEGCPKVFDAGVVSHPHPFQATIKARSERHELLILEGDGMERREGSREEGYKGNATY